MSIEAICYNGHAINHQEECEQREG